MLQSRESARPSYNHLPSEQNNLASAVDTARRISQRLNAVIRGREEVIELVVIALVADGHVLLEDYPGSGKTTLARALGESLVPDLPDQRLSPFRRIQFTPDLLPSDITGTTIFDVSARSFSFRPGPIFAHIVLADEINRTSPKVQSAMLEAMAEKQVTIDNETHLLDDLFFVIATQNPLDLAGTYPLPTPQLDRFLFKIQMKHISKGAELEVLDQYPHRSLELAEQVAPVGQRDLLRARHLLREGVHVAKPLKQGLVDLAEALRNDDRVLQGASTRSLVMSLPALQVRAALRDRDYVAPDDLEALAPHIFSHRIACASGVDETAAIVGDATKLVVEQLARQSLKRAS